MVAVSLQSPFNSIITLLYQAAKVCMGTSTLFRGAFGEWLAPVLCACFPISFTCSVHDPPLHKLGCNQTTTWCRETLLRLAIKRPAILWDTGQCRPWFIAISEILARFGLAGGRLYSFNYDETCIYSTGAWAFRPPFTKSALHVAQMRNAACDQYLGNM